MTSRSGPPLAGAAVGAALAFGLLLTAGITAAPSGAATGDSWSVPSKATVTLTGHGYGHGHGMSQYGARGAARQGLSWKQIVGFYYPGTQIARAGGTIKVLITADTTKDVAVEAQGALRLHRLGGRSTVLAKIRPKASRWRMVPLGHKIRVDYRVRGSRGWQRLTSFTGGAEFAAGRAPITLRLPGKASASYRGTLRSVDGQTVDVVALDEYVRGVVAAEMPATWEPQAVRAQAVAARTYAVFERASASGGYDLCDTSSCQVYAGVSGEQTGSDQAVRRTAHRVVTYSGKPAFAQFSSSDGGYNAAGSAPYLVAQADPYEAGSDNPYATWTVDVSDAELEQAFPKVGDLDQVSFDNRDGQGEWGGRVGTVTLSGTGGSVTVTGDAFRLALDLRSTWFTVTSVTPGRPAGRPAGRAAERPAGQRPGRTAPTDHDVPLPQVAMAVAAPRISASAR